MKTMRSRGKPVAATARARISRLAPKAWSWTGVHNWQAAKAQLRGFEKIGRGDAELRTSAQTPKEPGCAFDRRRREPLEIDVARQMVEIGGDDRLMLATRRLAAEMLAEDLGDDVLVIADQVAVPVARQAFKTMELGEGPEKSVLFRRRQLEQDAIDIEDDCCIIGHRLVRKPRDGRA